MTTQEIQNAINTVEKITPISFWDFCCHINERATIGDARNKYTKYNELITDPSFCDFLKTGGFASEVDFYFKSKKRFSVSIDVSEIIYFNHMV